MQLILKDHQLYIKATQDEKYDFVIAAAKGELAFEEIKQWIQSKLK